MQNVKIFGGNANPELAFEVAKHLGVTLGRAHVGHFSDGECNIEILENVRGRDTFIIQSTSVPTNDYLMELVLMADALRRASASSITAVMPYFGYARQDRRVRSARVPISAKVVASMLEAVKIKRIITVDLHADQIQGFFSIPVDNVYATPLLLEDMRSHGLETASVVSPDVGGVVRARAVAKRLNESELAIIDKRRPAPNMAEVMHIIGDIKRKVCIIVDDIVDTGGTLCAAAAALKQQGAQQVWAYCTHPVLSGDAMSNIMHSEIEGLVVTDTVPLGNKIQDCAKIRQISISHILANTIRRITQNESVSSMFMN